MAFIKKLEGKREENENIKLDNLYSGRISKKLDETAYKENLSNLKRYDDKETQVGGVDMTFTMDGNDYRCDEKAAITWRDLNTYAFEVTIVNKANTVQEGWLVNDKMNNDSYALIWLDRNERKTEKVKYADVPFDKIAVAIVKKKKLLDYLASINWTKEHLVRKANKIRFYGDKNYGNLFSDKCKFYFSTDLPEKPVNVLLPRKKVEELADKVFSFDSEGMLLKYMED